MKKLVTLITFLALAACSSQATDQPPVQSTAPAAGQEVTATPLQAEPAQTEQTLPTLTQAAQPTLSDSYPGPSQGEAPAEPITYPGIEQPGSPGVTYVPPAASDYSPQPGDDQLNRGQVFLQLSNSELRSMESYPVQVVAVLRGDLPDPCHKLRVVVTPPDSQNIVHLDVYSVVSAGEVCAAVLDPFEAPISLGGFAGGSFSVVVNGEELGKFDA